MRSLALAVGLAQLAVALCAQVLRRQARWNMRTPSVQYRTWNTVDSSIAIDARCATGRPGRATLAGPPQHFR